MLESPYFNIPIEEREEMLALLGSAFQALEQIRFAYTFGSFLNDGPFHDLDIGVYLSSPLEASACLETAYNLAGDLEALLRKAGYHAVPVDVRPLNQAPLSFCYHVFSGRLLFSRDEALRVSLVAKTFSQYLDLLPLRRQALKEAMRAWA